MGSRKDRIEEALDVLIGDRMDEIIERAIGEAAELSIRTKQSREDYEQCLRSWIHRIQTEIDGG